MKASTLGYEVSIAGRAGNSGKRAEVYFDINGKKLNPDRDYRNEECEYSVGDDGDAKADWKCFDIVYPISIQMPDGSILSIDGEEDTDLELVKEYYEENDTEEKPSMVFPLTIITYEGVTKTINSEEDMSDAYRGCSRRDRERDWDNDRECFELVYPVTYVLPDGSTIEISDEPRRIITHENSINDIDIEEPSSQPNSLVLSSLDQEVDIDISCSLFRSLCPVTAQPDWATIYIAYKGKEINHSSLLSYLLSFRNHQGFHEECVEKIFQDVNERCELDSLLVRANYLRRGGIEINPLRATHNNYDQALRESRQ